MINNLSEKTNKILNDFAESQLNNTSGFMTEYDSMSLEDCVDRNQISYKPGFSEEYFIDTFKLSMITESLTEQYAEAFRLGADLYNADWLRTYINGFWVPDELGHADPHKKILMNFGYTEHELDLMLKEADEQTSYKENQILL